MSRSFFNKFKILANLDNENFLAGLFLCSTIVPSHAIYSYSTKDNKVITVVEKYKFVRNGNTEFMIVDNMGRHYNVNNSLWFWKWNSIEDWTKLNTNQNIIIHYYGYRIPVLGIFPNVYRVSDTTEPQNGGTTVNIINGFKSRPYTMVH